MLYTIHQLLFVSLIIGIASAIIVWMVNRSRMLRLFTRQRTEIDAMLAWRAVEHENALIAANESLRVSNDQRRDVEQRLHRLRTEVNQRVGQYDDTIANLHRNLRTHQEKLREAQRRADAGDEAVVGERRAREVAELRLGEAKAKIEAFEAEVVELKAMVRGSNHDTMLKLEQQVRDLSEAKRELEVRFKTSQAAVGDRVALERRLVETQDRLRAAEGELSGAKSELSRVRVAHQAKSAVLEGRIRDYEQELEFAEARIDAVAAEQAEAQKQELDALQGKLSEAHRQLRIGREHIEERDEELDRLEEEIEELRAAAAKGDTDVEAELRKQVTAMGAELKGMEQGLAAAKAEAESAAAELAAVKEQAEAAEAELAAAQIANAAFEVGASENEQELGRLRGEVQELTAELGSARELAEQRDAELDALRGELAAAGAGDASAGSSGDARVAELAEKLRLSEAAVLRLEDELDSARVEILTAQSLPLSAEDETLREALEKELMEVRVRVAELEAAAVAREELAQAQAGIHRQEHASMEQALISAIDDLNAERQRSQAMEAQLRSAEQKAAGRGATTQAEVERLEEAHSVEVEAMAARLAKAESRLEEAGIIAQEHISAHDEELAGWHTRMQSYEVQLSQVNAQMAEQMGALVEVERSLSAAKAAQREAEAAAAAAIEEAAAKSAMLAEAEQQRDTFSAQVDELIAARPVSRTDSRLLTALESERHELETRVVAMEEALKEASRVAAEAPVVAEKELADLRGQLGELARLLSAREEELAVAVRERDEQRARAEALVNAAATAEQVTPAEPATAGDDELIAGLREQLRAQEEELGSLRDELQRANHRIRAVSLLSEQEFDPEAPDDLKVIAGIGPVLERRLREAGFTSYRDLAILDDAGLEALSGSMASLRNRIRREHWVVQAKKLHLAKHGEQL